MDTDEPYIEDPFTGKLWAKPKVEIEGEPAPEHYVRLWEVANDATTELHAAIAASGGPPGSVRLTQSPEILAQLEEQIARDEQSGDTDPAELRTHRAFLKASRTWRNLHLSFREIQVTTEAEKILEDGEEEAPNDDDTP
jgi:hypothetical protein